MQNATEQLETLSMCELFTYRFHFDKPNDIVDLGSDVRDLQYFPERLIGSYRDEWKRYIKREVAVNNSDLPDLNRLANEYRHNEKYQALVAAIKEAQVIEASDKVTIFNSPLRDKLKKLLEL